MHDNALCGVYGVLTKRIAASSRHLNNILHAFYFARRQGGWKMRAVSTEVTTVPQVTVRQTTAFYAVLAHTSSYNCHVAGQDDITSHGNNAQFHMR